MATSASTTWNTWVTGTGDTAWISWSTSGTTTSTTTVTVDGYYGRPVTYHTHPAFYGSPPVPGGQALPRAPVSVDVSVGQSTERYAAEKKSRELFEMMLTDEQKKDWKKSNSFWVKGQDGYWYQICVGTVYNVHKFDKQKTKELEHICFRPSGNVPDYDHYLVQKLVIENDIKSMVAVANVNIVH